jgi:hypothetical protein
MQPWWQMSGGPAPTTVNTASVLPAPAFLSQYGGTLVLAVALLATVAIVAYSVNND